MDTYLIVGLGNPGSDYSDTRHNAGFRVVDLLAQKARANYWKEVGGALVAKGTLEGHDVVFAKPQSFMNTSGGPVKKLMAIYAIDPDHLIVIHDELDIPAGDVRLKFGGGHAGHNGLRSIADKLTTRDWYRVRTGIGRPPGKMDPADYVLSVPRGKDAEDFDGAIAKAADAVEYLMAYGLDGARKKLHG